MGARQSKRSVDITTTPRKGEGEVVVEGEGKLEQIVEPDLKVTTNGTLHSEIEFADKEENAKEQIEENEKHENEVKENGVSEAEEVKTPDVESSGDQPANNDSTPGTEISQESGEGKVEETAETKKSKKEKKKKWSFRSISFSKKDKSKPQKDTEKNGEVKEVAEENAENATAGSDETAGTPEVNDSETPAKVEGAPENDEQSKSEVETKSAEETKTTDAVKTPSVEESPEPVCEEPKSTEPVEPVSSPKKEDVTSIEAPKVEESKPVDPVPVEETKEVRTEEVPPPLPSSNPPSPVTAFAESTKADALPADQVPSESQSISLPEKTSTESNIESENVIVGGIAPVEISSESSHVETIVSDPPPLTDNISPQSNADEKPSSPVESEQLSNDNSDIINDPPLSPPAEVLPSENSVLEAASNQNLSEPEDLPKHDPLEIKSESSEMVSETSQPQVIHSPVQNELETKETDSTELEREVEKPESPIPVSEPEPELTPIAPEASQLVINAQEVDDKSVPEVTDVAPEAKSPEVENETSFLNNVDSEINQNSKEAEPVVPAVVPEQVTAISEPVGNADSLPDISTESLPSLPEPTSESLPEPMSLPPVESVPEPIAVDSPPIPECVLECPISNNSVELPESDSVPKSPVSENLPASDEIPTPDSDSKTQVSESNPVSDSPLVLTNGNLNGLHSPTVTSDEPGPIKQVSVDDLKKEIRKEEGDNLSDKPTETPAIEE